MSAIDGRKVSYRDKPDWEGLVQGGAMAVDSVRVEWNKPRHHTGVHRITDLVLLDEAPTQEDLAALFNAQ